MNRVLVDTSAILALLVPTDTAHEQARQEFDRLASERATLFVTSYVLVETYALLGRRFGPAALDRFRREFAPLLQVFWIAREIHEKALDLLLADGRRDLSLVDAASLVVFREERLDAIFAFDRHLVAVEASGLV
jgi:predicted nucleic acid-binding protein